jgi:hypothetical protein
MVICCIHIIKSIVQILSELFVAGGVIFAAYKYWDSVKLTKSKWLHELYKSFYENDKFYKEIRQILDYEKSTEKDNNLKYEILKNNFGSDTNIELQEKLVDYLNFFEFIATLLKLNQIELNEINMVFGYYIINLYENGFLSEEKLVKNGFTNLPDLIKRVNELRAK